MATYNSTIEIQSEPYPTFFDITQEVTKIVKESGISNGIAVVYSKHTTCSVITQEDSHDETYKGQKYLFQDLLNIMERFMPTCLTEGQYLHPGPKHIEWAKGNGEEAWWSLNTDAHLRSVLLGRSEDIPIIDGSLELGLFAKIYFVDFDQVRARNRKVIVQIVGE